MSKIKWAICDDDEYFCYIYKSKLENAENMEFMWYATGTDELMTFIEKDKPDVLLLDIQMDTDMAGIDVIPSIKEQAPEIKIIMLTGHDDEDYIYSAIANGADNYILKDSPDEDKITEIISKVYMGSTTLSPRISRNLVNKTKNVETCMKSILYMFEIMSSLSKTELTILKEIYSGLSYKEISQRNFISESTTRNHVSRILKKFKASSMREVISELKELRIFEYMRM